MQKPADFFIGIVDLFAIFFPGVLLTYVLFQQYSPFLLSVINVSPENYWIAFIFVAYLMGHLIFMLGAKIDGLYDFHRRLKNPYTNESAFQNASKIKHQFLNETERESVNTYQWSISVLTTQYPDALIEVNRLVADSKFFRSLLVILPLLALQFSLMGNCWHGIILLLFIYPCYLRFYNRRLKSTTRAYQYIITLHGLGKLVNK